MSSPAVRTGIIENLARELELPPPVRLVGFFFLFILLRARRELFRGAFPPNSKGEIPDLVASFSIILAFAVFGYCGKRAKF